MKNKFKEGGFLEWIIMVYSNGPQLQPETKLQTALLIAHYPH